MIRVCTFSILLVSASFTIAEEPAAKPELDLSTNRLKSSYGIGLSIGRSLKNDGLEIDVPTLVAGLPASLDGTKAALTQDEFRAAITVFQQEMQAKMIERQKVVGEKNLAAGKAFLAENKKKDGVVTLESGLQYQVLKAGNGKRPKKTDRVKAHYHGTLIDGTVFDSSVEKGTPFTTAVTEVIAGWTEALQLMQVGDKWRLFVPSDLAYGARARSEEIGPHTTLIFEMELLEIE